MTRRLLAPLALSLVILAACSNKDSNPVDLGDDTRVFEVPAEMGLAAALAEAEPGDHIRLTGAGPAIGDFDLPPDVSLYRHPQSQFELFEIIGSLSNQSSGVGSIIEGLKISNPDPAGSGLTLVNCRNEVRNVWLVDCAGAGLELIGNSAVYIHESDFENCRPGVLIRDVFSSGHHIRGNAPRIDSNNFLDNLPLLVDVGNDDVIDELGPNLVFRNVSAGDTVSVSYNFWGAMPGEVDPETTIWDRKDEEANRGWADTLDESDYYSPLPFIHERDWRD